MMLNRSLPTGCLLAFASLLLACATPTGLADELPGPSDEMLGRGRELLSRLRSGEPIHVIAFGDSLTAGWGTDGGHAYHRVFTDALKHRFTESEIRVTVRGHPGETTRGALRRARAEVIALQPDLVLVQFGGNDMGWGRSVSAFRASFSRLLALLTEQTNAVVIACLPPIVDEDPRNAWSEAARQVAAEAGTPTADLDHAIHQGDHDFRGPFPHGSHPGSFTHVIMAKEVLRAFDVVIQSRATLSCALLGDPVLADARDYELRAAVRCLGDAPVDCVATVEHNGWVAKRSVTVRPDGELVLDQAMPLPATASSSRSLGLPVRLWVKGEEYACFDAGWLVLAPVVSADHALDDGATPSDLTWHEVGADALVMGRHLWLGPEDLSGRFNVLVLPDKLRFVVNVTDNDITVADLNDPAGGDSVELYLDLRRDNDQGKPVYSPDVLALQIIPPSKQGQPTRWRSMQPLPEDLEEIAVTCRRTDDGYEVQVDVPLAPIRARRGDEWQGIGFDVGINDADGGGTRKTQMMWAGIPDNYLNPAYFAGLYVDVAPKNATRRTLR